MKATNGQSPSGFPAPNWLALMLADSETADDRCSAFHPARLAQHWELSEAERDDLSFRARWGLSDDELDSRFASEHRGLGDDQIRIALGFHRATRRFAENHKGERDSDRSFKDAYGLFHQGLVSAMARSGLRYGDPLDDQFAVSQLENPDGSDFWTALNEHLVARDYADSGAAPGNDRESAYLAYRWAQENAVPAAEPAPAPPLNRSATALTSFVQCFDLGCRDRGSGEDDADGDGGFRQLALPARPGIISDVLTGRLRHLDAAAGFFGFRTEAEERGRT